MMGRRRGLHVGGPTDGEGRHAARRRVRLVRPQGFVMARATAVRSMRGVAPVAGGEDVAEPDGACVRSRCDGALDGGVDDRDADHDGGECESEFGDDPPVAEQAPPGLEGEEEAGGERGDRGGGHDVVDERVHGGVVAVGEGFVAGHGDRDAEEHVGHDAAEPHAGDGDVGDQRRLACPGREVRSSAVGGSVRRGVRGATGDDRLQVVRGARQRSPRGERCGLVPSTGS